MKIVIVISLFIFLNTLYFALDSSFKTSIPESFLIYTTVDYFLSVVVVFIIWYKFSHWFNFEYESIRSNLNKIAGKYVLILYLFLLIAIYESYISFQLIMDGIPRHELLREYGRANFSYMLVSGIFKVLFPVFIFFKVRSHFVFLSLLGLLFSLVITASRSELSYAVNFLLILCIFKVPLNHIVRMGVLGFLLIFLAIYSTVFLQSRPISDGVTAFYDMYQNLFTYKAYSYHLSHFSITISQGFETVLFPFFGYPSEILIRLFTDKHYSVDSNFISDLRYIGSNPITGRPYLANVVYPWWSWFYGSFGYFGLLLKMIYIYILLFYFAKNRMMFSTINMLSTVLLGASGAHPFMTVTHTLAFCSYIILDLMYKKLSKKIKF